mmetsp:Transcript_110720/g.236492  ORF Transcript_110720/g.236492 Transcript_110720/m.236492 type:complete len:105 (+) Transcript_110720:145-459(+)
MKGEERRMHPCQSRRCSGPWTSHSWLVPPLRASGASCGSSSTEGDSSEVVPRNCDLLCCGVRRPAGSWQMVKGSEMLGRADFAGCRNQPQKNPSRIRELLFITN